MCIAILKPKGQTLSITDLEECWGNNPHGAGLMYAENGKLIIRKGWMKWRNFKRAWERGSYTEKTVALHFRISTGGNIDQANCHPHLIVPSVAVVHNGIFTDKDIPIIDKNYSDTCHFVRMLRELGDPHFLTDKDTRKWIEKVSLGSKLIFMGSDGSWEIVNAKEGTWDKGCWYSNDTYKYPMYSFSQGYEPWNRNPVTGTWEPIKGKCAVCDNPLYLEAEVASDHCEMCVTAMYQDIRSESDSVYGNEYPVEQIETAKRIHEESVENTWEEEKDRLLIEEAKPSISYRKAKRMAKRSPVGMLGLD